MLKVNPYYKLKTKKNKNERILLWEFHLYATNETRD